MMVTTIVGVWCFDAPTTFSPPGVCTDVGDILICHVNVHDLPIRPSYYDPFIEHNEQFVRDLQCQEPCELLGDGTLVVDGYGRFAACVPGWYWRHVDLVWPDGFSLTRQCRDHGGDVRPKCGDVFTIEQGNGRFEYRCFIPIDLLERHEIPGLLMLIEWRFIDGNEYE